MMQSVLNPIRHVAGQMKLLDTGAPFRATDPEPSRQAARQQDATGRRESDMARVLEALRRTPYLSSRELAELHHMDRYMVARRLPDLEKRGLVERKVIEMCDTLWVAKEEGGAK